MSDRVTQEREEMFAKLSLKSPVLKRIIDEIRDPDEVVESPAGYNRYHNRHNRSGYNRFHNRHNRS